MTRTSVTSPTSIPISLYRLKAIPMTVTTAPPLRLIRLPQALFDPTSPNFTSRTDFFTKVINLGYGYNRKYNVITSTRIKSRDMFLDDLGLYKPESFLIVLVKTGEVTGDVMEMLPDLEIEDMSVDFDPQSELKVEDVLGTIGGKAYVDEDSKKFGWELTAVTSFSKGVGTYLVKMLIQLAKDAGKDCLFCSVIYEHGLSDYYRRFGFVECGERLLQKVDETGRVIGGDLEDGIYATRDFHVAFLIMDFPK